MSRKAPLVVSKATHERLMELVLARRKRGFFETLGSMADKIIESYKEPE